MSTPTKAIAWKIIRKDLLDHFHSKRFHVGALLCLILFGFTAFIRFTDFKQSHQERNIFLQRWIPSVQEQLERAESVQVENTRAVSPMGVVSMGLEPVLPFRLSSTKEGLRLGESRGARNTIDALFGHLDLVFVIGILLSLLAIAFSYDSICGERVQGTLAVLLSYPVKRSTLLVAKIVAHGLTLAACLLPSFLLVLTMAIGMGVPLLNLGHWALFLIVSLVYLLVFASLGVTVSAMVHRPPDAMLAALFLWVISAFIAPRGIGLLVNAIQPPSKAIELAVKEEEAISRLRGAFFKQKQAAFQDLVNNPDRQKAQEDFKNATQKAALEFGVKRRQTLDRLWDEQNREEALREQYVRVFSTVTPTALFNEIGAELSWTGYRQRDHFLREARIYDEKIGRKLAESVQTFFASTGNGRTGQAMVLHADIKPYLIPFSTTWASSRLLMASILVPLVTLILYLGAIFVLGYRAVLKMDVRA